MLPTPYARSPNANSVITTHTCGVRHHNQGWVEMSIVVAAEPGTFLFMVGVGLRLKTFMACLQ